MIESETNREEVPRKLSPHQQTEIARLIGDTAAANKVILEVNTMFSNISDRYREIPESRYIDKFRSKSSHEARTLEKIALQARKLQGLLNDLPPDIQDALSAEKSNMILSDLIDEAVGVRYMLTRKGMGKNRLDVLFVTTLVLACEDVFVKGFLPSSGEGPFSELVCIVLDREESPRRLIEKALKLVNNVKKHADNI